MMLSQLGACFYTFHMNLTNLKQLLMSQQITTRKPFTQHKRRVPRPAQFFAKMRH